MTAAIGRVAAGLAERVLGRHDVAVIFAPNCPDYPAVFHGVLSAGAVCSPANALYTPVEPAHQLRDSGARVLFASTDSLDRARAAVAEDKVRVEETIVLGSARGAPGPVGETGFDEFLACTAPTPKAVLSSVKLIMSAAAPLDRDLAQALAKRLDAVVVQGYGLTESSPTTGDRRHRRNGEEVPKAFVVRRVTQSGLDAEEVQAFLAARVAPYRKARLVEFLDQI